MRAAGNETGRRSFAAASGAAGWLGLAAAPTFAIMALLTGTHGRDMPDMLCAATQDASPLTGMVSMYLLMSAFHSAPWLKLIGRWLSRRAPYRARSRFSDGTSPASRRSRIGRPYQLRNEGG